MMLSNDIWVLAEQKEHEPDSITWEMLSEAKKLARSTGGQACVCLIGYGLEEYMPSIIEHGVEKLYLLENEIFSEYSLDIYTSALQRLITKYKPLITMFGATILGSELAARVAARLKLACMTEVKRIGMKAENVVMAKSCYEDKVYQNLELRPQNTVVVTILPGDMENEGTNTSRELEVLKEELTFEGEKTRTRTLKFIKGDPKKIRLEEADLILAGGKGIGKNINLLEGLADILDASIGGTRPLVDDRIIPFQRQIGITGKSVSPRLLMACGISGANEFMAGIDKARRTIAINNDSEAPIFRWTDLSVHADVNKVLPALIKKLKQQKERGEQ
jgi:electron transfer flavoprotein alpha subunit